MKHTAELGWYAMLVPEELGGGSVSGNALADLAVVANERGRGLQPGPFITMNAVAAGLAEWGSPEQQAEILGGVAAGEMVVGWAASGPGAWSPGEALTADRQGDAFVLSGQASLVQDGALAEWLLVTAGGQEGLTQFVVRTSTAGLSVRPLKSLDISQRFAVVEFDGVKVSSSAVVGEVGDAAEAVERQLQVALVLSLAETVGALDVMFEMTRQYSLDRIAFGRPIGSFQAIKHQMADMSLSLEAGKAVSTAATEAVAARQSDAGEIASMAKAWVGDTGFEIVQGCSQVFGGIGQTWEHDSHLFLRRVSMNSLLFGDSAWHRERICALHEF
jgi:alkylation response protein AidB-like acyl-CoA dehydrogenase